MLRGLQPETYGRCIVASNWRKSPVCDWVRCFRCLDFTNTSKWPTNYPYFKVAEQKRASILHCRKESRRDNRNGVEMTQFRNDIGVGARKFLGVRRIFARISPNLPEKLLWAFCPQFFSHKEHEDLFLVWPPK